jgi:hypothetical protein
MKNTWDIAVEIGHKYAEHITDTKVLNQLYIDINKGLKSVEKGFYDHSGKQERIICAGSIKLIAEILIYHIRQGHKIDFFDNKALKESISAQLDIALKEPGEKDDE